MKQHFVAVVPHKFVPGFEGDNSPPETSEVMPLMDALHREYDTHAHMAMYVMRGRKRQFRINKRALDPEHGFNEPLDVHVFVADVDNPKGPDGKKLDFNAEIAARYLRQYTDVPVLHTAGVYRTEHGLRIVQPLTRPLDARVLEPYLREWLSALGSAGIDYDDACDQWNRLFALPRIRKTRHKKRFRAPWMLLDRMTPIDPDLYKPPDAGLDGLFGQPSRKRKDEPKQRGASAAARSPPRKPIEYFEAIPLGWEAGIKEIAGRVSEVQTDWHPLFLAISGALVRRGVAGELVPAIVRAISEATGLDTKTRDREVGARSTVENRRRGRPTTGLPTLRKTWPDVARAVSDATARGEEAKLVAEIRTPAPEPKQSLTETTASLEQAIRKAPMGVTHIGAECGIGKTRAAIKVAVERARTPYASPKAKGKRAPPQSKTGFSVDKHSLGDQIAESLEAEGVPVLRLKGPLSVKNDDGTFACHYKEYGDALAHGGLSVQRVLCEGRGFRCEHYEGCRARLGREGSDNAPVAIAPHALMRELAEAIGLTGMLIFDEPPQLIEPVVVTQEDFQITRRAIREKLFEARYTDALGPALHALGCLLTMGSVSPGDFRSLLESFECIVPDEVFRRALEHVPGGQGDMVGCALAALEPGTKDPSPMPRRVAILQFRRNIEAAKTAGRASRVLRLLWDALTQSETILAEIEEIGEERRLVLARGNTQFAAVLRRQAATVVMDASIDVDAPIYERVLHYPPFHHQFRALDGAPVKRQMIRCPSANRSHWFSGKRLELHTSLVRAVMEAVDWLLERGVKSAGVVTYKPLRVALEAAVSGDVAGAEMAWRDAGQPKERLGDFMDALGPILRRFQGEFVFGHYGAVRGLDAMKTMDALVTVGDSYQNLGHTIREARFLLTEPSEPPPTDDAVQELVTERSRDKCKAELEQAHGRLRTVHRTVPGCALHVGAVLPGGSGWHGDGVDERSIGTGRLAEVGGMTADELKELVAELGGVRSAARATGLSRSLLSLCVQGSTITGVTAEKLRIAISEIRGREKHPS